LGPKVTKVEVIADPSVRANIHTLEIEGNFGKAVCRVENLPSPDNPRTSYLAALSAVAAIKRLLGGVEIGG
jgi:aspartate dehydrogenase